MIGSPDLLAFTGTEGFGEGEEDQEGRGLPEELSVPLLPAANPWSTSAHFHRDFILVAEFSEQVGPKPVLTVPDDPGVIGSFDLNHFSVRIMSVDYQASGPYHAPPTSPGPRLNFSEDSKVVLGDSADDAFAYVHHMTLYDLEARGMVRPFCMAYVCSDQRKLMENFSDLSTSFSQASDSLKTGNRQAFSTELQRKLQELEYMRASLQKTDGFTKDKADELEALDRSILNHRDLLRQVTSYPNRKLKQPDFLPYDPADSVSPVAVLPPELCPSTSTSASRRADYHLKPLDELCNVYFLSLMKEQLVETERRLRGDRGALLTARATRSLSRRLTLINFLFELWSPEDREEEEERESAEAEPQRAAGRKSAADAFRSEPVSLESFCSCVEEIPIKLEAGEAPEPSVAMEMTGSVSSGDSIEVLGTERSYRTQQVIAGCDSRETPAGVTDPPCRRVIAADSSVRRVRAYARRANSEDSIEVLSTTESIVPDDLTAITEEEAGLQHDEETTATALRKEDEDGEREDRGDVSGKEDDGVCEDDGPEKRRQDESPPQAAPSLPGRPVSATPPVAVAEVDRWAPPCAPLRLLSVDETSDCTSFTSSSDPPSPTHSVHSKAGSDQRKRRRRRKAGLRALRFLKQNSFSQHALFCLLSGRPLVVIGGDESLVRKLVDALSLFLPAPGPDGNAVMLCLTTPLQLSDLLTWRLIGIHRSSSSSSASIVTSLTRYARYLALLDLDQRTARCPSYSGAIVGRLADPHTGISRGVTYLLHLESCLTALASRALLCTFSPAAGGEGERLSPCSSEHDKRVMHFLCDLIRQRHAGRGPPVLRFSYNSVHVHRNTFAA